MKGPKQSLIRAAGFTLIEVILAITLLGLITTILHGAFDLGHRAVQKAEARAEESQRLRSVGELLAGYIRSAYPYRTSPRDPAVFFAGEEERLTFISALSIGLGGRGMAKVSLFWDGDLDGGGVLALEEELPAHIEGQAGYRNRVALQKGVAGLRMDYLDPEGGPDRWVGEWDGKERKALPRAVRIRLAGDRGREIEWIFPIMMTVMKP